MKYIVYLTTCLANKKIYVGVHKTDTEDFDGYIGCGVNIRRPQSYKKSKTPFQYAVSKFGVQQFVRVTLKSFDSEEDAYAFEAEIVNEEFIRRPDTYNLILGGRYNTEQAKQYKKVYMYDLEGNFLMEFESVTQANKYLKPTATTGGHLSRAIKCGHLYFGYQFSYEKLDYMKRFESKTYKRYDVFTQLNEERKEKKPVGRYDQDGQLLETFSCISECVNAGYKNAKQVILGKRKKCKNYIFKYLEN